MNPTELRSAFADGPCERHRRMLITNVATGGDGGSIDRWMPRRLMS
jgi:hypothetical protein